jgi:uncharacterized protein
MGQFEIWTMKDLKRIDWAAVTQSLNEKGYAKISQVLSVDECVSSQQIYPDAGLYRSTINMERYRFGKGEYKYFKYPLPDVIQKLREELYPQLSVIANEWMGKLKIDTVYPQGLHQLLETCHAGKQLRPTPLILKYEAGGFNTLHQDLYGDIYFPFQAVFALSSPQKDFAGGQFVLIEQVPRAQSKARVIDLEQGDALIFTTNFRPVKNSKGGYYRANMKHGVAEVLSGLRYALGVIFHDAT